jgi:hypothetical protein
LNRQIIDNTGTRWDVWEVDPKDLERHSYDRRSMGRDSTTPASAAPVAWTPANVEALHPDLRSGWLCFQSNLGRRRFAPIPARWQELPENVLRVMLDVATPVARAGSAGSQTTPQNE